MNRDINLFPIAVSIVLSFSSAFAWADENLQVGRLEQSVITLKDLQAQISLVQDEKKIEAAPHLNTAKEMIAYLAVRRLLAKMATAEGEIKDPLLNKKVQLYQEKLLSEYMLEQYLDSLPPADYEAVAREEYLLNKDRFKLEQASKFSHILFSTKKHSDNAARNSALKALAALRVDPDRFETMARELSDDSRSGERGGALKWATKEKLEPEFADAAFSLSKVGEISEIVRTRHGYHIIRLDEERESRYQPFDEVKAGLIEKAKREIRNKRRIDYVQAIRRRGLAFNNQELKARYGK